MAPNSTPFFQILHAKDRGATKFDWLDGHHSFSFGGYRNRDYMHFASLRVLNDDRVRGGGGFATHAHDNFEILTYMLDGALAHKDSMGNGSTIAKGDVQLMSAGSGVTHSEFNASATEEAHLLQIWFFPLVMNIAPRYAQKNFSIAEKNNRLALIVSPDGRDHSLPINQDVMIYATLLNGEKDITHPLEADRFAWVHVARGTVTLNGETLAGGDGAGITGQELHLSNAKDAEILIFDMAPFTP